MTEMVSRAGWGAQKPLTTSALPAGQVASLTLHWGGPAVGIKSHADCAGKVRSWQTFHIRTKGWADLAYSFVICPHGVVFEGRGWGRRTAANGTNAGNSSSHAVCYLGGEGEPFTDAAKVAFRWIYQEHLKRHPRARVVFPHDHWKPTGCPGPALEGWIGAGMPAPASAPGPGVAAAKPAAAKPAAKPGEKAPPFPAGGPIMVRKRITHSARVEIWQRQMAKRGWKITVDGKYGEESAAVARAFQKEKGLLVDGRVGPKTWAAAWTESITA